MKRIVLLLFCLLPLLAVAQSVTVPPTIEFAGLHLRLTDKGRRAVQEKVDALRRYQPSFQARVDLADAYFPIIDRVFKEKGIPLDYHYLSLQESGLQGDAESIHAAVGYWQFKRESAVELGVQVNDAVDERKHITVATYGAAQYLLRNNKVLHNWVNTLLTYNLGLSGAKPYTLPTDYDATEMEITQDTHPYILTFLAHKIAFEQAVGQNPNPPMLLQEFPAVGGQTLSAIAFSLQTEADILAKHNRWLLDKKVPTDRAYTVLVPVTDPIQLTAMAAKQNLGTKGQLLSQPEMDPQNADFVRINGLRALIALPGDTKESLAQRGGLKMRRFLNYNDLMAFDNIVVGQPYFVQKKRDKAAVAYHTAQPGESVAIVSQKYGVRAKAIWNKNRMARNEELRPGRVLWLQHTRPREVPIEYAPSTNATAQAAFERPLARQTAKPTPAAAPAPAPSSPKPKATEPEPYAGNVAAHNRLEEDAAEEDSVTMTSGDLATENLNDLPAAPAATVTTDSTAETESTTEPAAAPPAPAAPRTVYAGRPTQQAPSTPTPSTEPVTEGAASNPAETPVAKTPTPAPTPKTPAAVVLRDPAPASTPAASKPAATTAPSGAAAPLVVPVATEALPANGLYIVQKSEGIYAIARRYGLRPADLIAWNELPPNPSLRLGQTLRLTGPSTATSAATTATPTTPAPAAAPKPTSSPVSAPASAPKTAAPAATAAPSPRPAAASASTVSSPPPATSPAPATNVVRHTVEAKESMYSISRKYKVTIKQIMEWNNKPDFNVKPGEVLVIQPAN
ncbi:LysM peptidoglycan-binding domain-containing protein [Hymenobacter sp. GOD-10R]|uniref:LysM peptidoglycan-binding domain-containing protein n=1 Tax=Hymenobacter sp. GOD-10R TaxID=3093922 RepID=UPI002D76E2A8|nr:LysM peptidoglycan-binding domain-containing protein [Hymenobacter sp. GOD-10R]WRQ29648.1 LysM peptidoglycan-binding domain-containing protein [Hymenobacter sp. GOD-10R]